MEKTKIRVAPSLGGGFERTFEEAWGLETYNAIADVNKPTVFAGIYGLPDFYALWRHKGKRYVFWCGSDIRHLKNGYWLDDKGKTRISPVGISDWINKYCENWCENKAEQQWLRELGIQAKISPSFLGDVDKFKVSYIQSDTPKLYASVSGDDFILYGWYLINKLAVEHPAVEFHLYGNNKIWEAPGNVIVHGRVSNEQMNEEIKDMQGCIRLINMEGFSEIVAKSMLMGQYPVSAIDYPYTLNVEEIRTLFDKDKPNLEGRNYLINNLNKYPWVE